MGLLVAGKWQNEWYDTESSDGRFERKAPSFRNWVTKDGSAGPSGISGFKAEPDRYHLYVSLAQRIYNTLRERTVSRLSLCG